MKWCHEKKSPEYLQAYIDKLTQSILMEDTVSRTDWLEDYWNTLTGQDITFHSYTGHVYVYINMGKKMENGEYPSKAYHLALFMEELEEVFGYRIKAADRRESVDKYDQNFNYEGWKHFPSVAVHVTHGGNCKLVKVDEEIIVKPIYETICE